MGAEKAFKPGTWAYPLEDFEHDKDGQPLTMCDICERLNGQLTSLNQQEGRLCGVIRVNPLKDGASPSGIGNRYQGVILLIEKKGEESA